MNYIDLSYGYGKKWSAADTQRLRTLWAEKLSCSEIAHELGPRFTKNSVIGKAQRLKLPQRVPGRSIRSYDNSRRAMKAALRPQKRKLKPFQRFYDVSPRVRYPQAPVDAPTGPGVTLEKRTGCCFPTNDGRPFLFCDAPGKAYGESVYCDFHINAMYQPRSGGAL